MNKGIVLSNPSLAFLLSFNLTIFSQRYYEENTKIESNLILSLNDIILIVVFVILLTIQTYIEGPFERRVFGIAKVDNNYMLKGTLDSHWSF